MNKVEPVATRGIESMSHLRAPGAEKSLCGTKVTKLLDEDSDIDCNVCADIARVGGVVNDREKASS